MTNQSNSKLIIEVPTVVITTDKMVRYFFDGISSRIGGPLSGLKLLLLSLQIQLCRDIDADMPIVKYYRNELRLQIDEAMEVIEDKDNITLKDSIIARLFCQIGISIGQLLILTNEDLGSWTVVSSASELP